MERVRAQARRRGLQPGQQPRAWRVHVTGRVGKLAGRSCPMAEQQKNVFNPRTRCQLNPPRPDWPLLFALCPFPTLITKSLSPQWCRGDYFGLAPKSSTLLQSLCVRTPFPEYRRAHLNFLFNPLPHAISSAVNCPIPFHCFECIPHSQAYIPLTGTPPALDRSLHFISLRRPAGASPFARFFASNAAASFTRCTHPLTLLRCTEVSHWPTSCLRLQLYLHHG